MKISFGLLGLAIVLAVLAALWPVGSPPPPVAAIERAGAAFPPNPLKDSNQSRATASELVLPTPDKPGIDPRLVQPPMLPDTSGVPRDTGPFIDADPGKPSAQPLGPELPPRDTGPFVDAGGPPDANLEASETVQDIKRIPVSPPKPLQFP
ncbi:MAG: hypothetical protein NTX45_04050 [Proteobacteria bacterium]|nr:hypothetical protein [Pseudomonadota bacterium]